MSLSLFPHLNCCLVPVPSQLIKNSMDFPCHSQPGMFISDYNFPERLHNFLLVLFLNIKQLIWKNLLTVFIFLLTFHALLFQSDFCVFNFAIHEFLLQSTCSNTCCRWGWRTIGKISDSIKSDKLPQTWDFMNQRVMTILSATRLRA